MFVLFLLSFINLRLLITLLEYSNLSFMGEKRLNENTSHNGHNVLCLFYQVGHKRQKVNILPLISDHLYSYRTDVYKSVSKTTQLQKLKL